MSRSTGARARCGTLVAALLSVLALAVPLAQAHGGRFTKPLKLPKTPPKGQLQGGEPSVAFDSGGKYVYVVAPGGEAPQGGGVGFWRSANGGRTFPMARAIGSLSGGGDADVSVGPDHTVYVADLEVVGNALCRSHDHGKTFDSGCDTGIATNETGYESDREWVNPSPTDKNLVYFSYHDFAGEVPLVYFSTSGGAPNSFTPCGPVLEPGGEAEQNAEPGGTNQGKLSVSKNGTVYVPILEPTNPATVTDPYNNFYVAIARHGCDSSTGFKDRTAFSNPGANLANIFPYVISDNHGDVYAAFTGRTGLGKKGRAKHFGAYLLTSRDGGRHWSRPKRVDPRHTKATSLASLTLGRRPGQVALGFYTTKTTRDPNADKNKWQFRVATRNRFHGRFRYTRITHKPIHYGAICTQGILCTGGRNLLDFSSVGMNPKTGCVLAVFAGDPYDTPANGKDDEASVYVSRQKTMCFRKHHRRHPPAPLTGHRRHHNA
jgi:hypothetical protein